MAVSAPGERQEQGSVVASVDREGSGWVLFAAIALGVACIMRIFDAIWAFQYH